MSENQNVKNRLKSYIEHIGISVRQFERDCGLCNAYVSSIRQSIQPDSLAKIVDKFPTLNPGWLMTGEGTMLREDATADSFDHKVAEPKFSYGIHGDNNQNNMNGTDNSVVNALIEQLKEKDQQIDRLLKIIEKMQ